MKGKRIRKRSRKRSRRIQTSAAAYPSAAERERIVERRDKLLRKMLEILVVPQADDRKMSSTLSLLNPTDRQRMRWPIGKIGQSSYDNRRILGGRRLQVGGIKRPYDNPPLNSAT
jgi:hypothetical protein